MVSIVLTIGLAVEQKRQGPWLIWASDEGFVAYVKSDEYYGLAAISAFVPSGVCVDYLDYPCERGECVGSASVCKSW